MKRSAHERKTTAPGHGVEARNGKISKLELTVCKVERAGFVFKDESSDGLMADINFVSRVSLPARKPQRPCSNADRWNEARLDNGLSTPPKILLPTRDSILSVLWRETFRSNFIVT